MSTSVLNNQTWACCFSPLTVVLGCWWWRPLSGIVNFQDWAVTDIPGQGSLDLNTFLCKQPVSVVVYDFTPSSASVTAHKARWVGFSPGYNNVTCSAFSGRFGVRVVSWWHGELNHEYEAEAVASRRASHGCPRWSDSCRVSLT